MASFQPVSFAAPGYDYGTDIAQIERRRAMAQMLQQQGLQPIQEQPVAPGQFAVPNSPWQSAAKLGQILAAKRQEAKADTQQRELAARSRQDLADVMTRAQKAYAGTPATAISEDASGNVTPAQPAVPGDPMAAANIYMQDPRTAALGTMLMQKEIESQQRKRMLADILKPTQLSGPQPSYGSPGFQPSGTPQGPLAGLPPQVTALVTSGDPELQKLGTILLEANKGIAQRPGAPVVNPFTGQVIAQPTPSVPQGVQLQSGPNGWQASQVPGFAAAQQGLHSIPNPSAPMMTIKTSSGQDIQLTQPEYLQWQQSGQLPPRLGGQQPQRSMPPTGAPAPSGAFRVPGAPGLGIIGAGQTQQDIINQARQQAGGKAVDEQFAKDYAAFVQGGSQDMAKQLAQLQDVSRALKVPGNTLTGTVAGNTPMLLKNITNPQSVAMQERVEEVVQRSLRAILGAQFTEKEGERLIARAYNPRLSPQENAIRVDRLFTQLNQAFQQKKAAASYFEKNGTLEGWKGKLPTIGDFDPDAGATSGADPLGIR